MSMVSILVPEDLEHVLKSVLERDPAKDTECSEPALRHTWPNCTSNGRRSTFRQPALQNCWAPVHGSWTTCYGHGD
jgi:hypothetical protein